jgi:predicted Zn finger-like uncharacterized protein
MSLATRCPACGTTFKVVRDQLRISDGWVRCGRCSHVFDGAEHLHDSEAAVADHVPSAPSDSDATPPPVTPVISQGPGVAPLADIDFFSNTLRRLQVDDPSSEVETTHSLAPPPAITDHIPQPARTEPVHLEMPSSGWPVFNDYAPAPAVPTIEFPDDDLPIAKPFGAPAIDAWSRLPSLQLGDVPGRVQTAAPVTTTIKGPGADVDDAQLQKALRRARVKSAKIAKARAKVKDVPEPAAVMLSASEPVEDVPAGLPELAGRRSRRVPLDTPRNPVVRRGWPWRTTAAAVLLLLAAQVVYQERSAIVARQPAWRPAFASACEVLGCQLAALQRISDITIDGASFAREKSGEGYQLSFTLRNRAGMPLAMPAVELALIDLQERTVVRRVLRPADYGAPAVLAANAERTTFLPMALAGEDAATLPRVAGFHLDAFYP